MYRVVKVSEFHFPTFWSTQPAAGGGGGIVSLRGL
jgi:hypothetical protein